MRRAERTTLIVASAWGAVCAGPTVALAAVVGGGWQVPLAVVAAHLVVAGGIGTLGVRTARMLRRPLVVSDLVPPPGGGGTCARERAREPAGIA